MAATDWTYIDGHSAIILVCDAFYDKLFQLFSPNILLYRAGNRKNPCWYISESIITIQLKTTYHRRFRDAGGRVTDCNLGVLEVQLNIFQIVLIKVMCMDWRRISLGIPRDFGLTLTLDEVPQELVDI